MLPPLFLPLLDATLVVTAMTLLAWAIATSPWHVLARPLMQHAWLGTVVLVLCAWRLPGVPGAAPLHLLGAAGATLLLGPRLALAALGGVVAILWATQRLPMPPAQAFCLDAALPVLLTGWLARWPACRSPGSAGPARLIRIGLVTWIACAASVLAQAGLQGYLRPEKSAWLWQMQVPAGLLLALAEAQLTVLVAAVLWCAAPAARGDQHRP